MKSVVIESVVSVVVKSVRLKVCEYCDEYCGEGCRARDAA